MRANSSSIMWIVLLAAEMGICMDRLFVYVSEHTCSTCTYICLLSGSSNLVGDNCTSGECPSGKCSLLSVH